MVWLQQNLGTVLVSAVILLILAAITVYEVRKKKSGKGGCSCGCGGCAMRELCHPQKQEKTDNESPTEYKRQRTLCVLCLFSYTKQIANVYDFFASAFRNLKRPISPTKAVINICDNQICICHHPLVSF